MHNESLRKLSCKNGRLKIKAIKNTDNCFTIFQYKTEEPKNIELWTPISL